MDKNTEQKLNNYYQQTARDFGFSAQGYPSSPLRSFDCNK